MKYTRKRHSLALRTREKFSLKGDTMSTKHQVREDLVSTRLQDEKSDLQKKYRALLRYTKMVEAERDAVKQIREVSTHTIRPLTRGRRQNEATAVVLASDWHIEEEVKSSDVNGLNTFNLDIARRRVEHFWSTTLRLVQIYSRDIPINTLVVALLGDFISGSIHEELLETAQLSPMDAIMKAQEWIASGIQFLLDNSKLNLVIPCVSGNHARITHKPRIATEKGHSLEYFMYHNLAQHFAGNKRVKFLIAESYHVYLDVYDYKIRMHHGHAIRYQGGIGGLFIPAFKAISQWNKARNVNLETFGHWHSRKDGGNFLCNGSLIGFNAYAISIKADFEKPSQTFFLVDRKRGRTLVTPILFPV